MKVAYFAESPADQSALTILTEAVLGRKTEPVMHAGLRHRGWPMVLKVLPAVLKELHYHTDAEGFVFVVDSDNSPPHLRAHEPPGPSDPQCRLCQLRGVASEALRQVRPRTDRQALKIALGVAVPTIEAWLLCGVDSHVTEAAWANGLKERPGRMPYSKGSLKRQLYGSSHPSLSIETKAMTTAAERLARNLASLEHLFPDGFGALAKALRAW